MNKHEEARKTPTKQKLESISLPTVTAGKLKKKKATLQNFANSSLTRHCTSLSACCSSQSEGAGGARDASRGFCLNPHPSRRQEKGEGTEAFTWLSELANPTNPMCKGEEGRSWAFSCYGKLLSVLMPALLGTFWLCRRESLLWAQGSVSALCWLVKPLTSRAALSAFLFRIVAYLLPWIEVSALNFTGYWRDPKHQLITVPGGMQWCIWFSSLQLPLVSQVLVAGLKWAQIFKSTSSWPSYPGLSVMWAVRKVTRSWLTWSGWTLLKTAIHKAWPKLNIHHQWWIC